MNKLRDLCLKTDNLEHVDVFKILHFAKSCRRLLFYGYLYNDDDFDNYFEQVKFLLSSCIHSCEKAEIIMNKLSEVRGILETDIEAVLKGDPAAKSKQEVVLCYPGLEAITYYRVAHLIDKEGYSLVSRIISEYAHRKCQVDIHPKASIGSYFCIDHATGVVIGETAIVGKNVRIYQGVTLGAKWLNDISKVSGKRHPTICDNVIIYANATILGGDTIIKEGSVIGANAFITNSN